MLAPVAIFRSSSPRVRAKSRSCQAISEITAGADGPTKRRSSRSPSRRPRHGRLIARSKRLLRLINLLPVREGGKAVGSGAGGVFSVC